MNENSGSICNIINQFAFVYRLIYILFSKMSSAVSVFAYVDKFYVQYYTIALISILKQCYNSHLVRITALDKRRLDLAEELVNYSETRYKLIADFDECAPKRMGVKHLNEHKIGIADGIRLARVAKIEILFMAVLVGNKKRVGNIPIEMGTSTLDLDIVPIVFTFNLPRPDMENIGEIKHSADSATLSTVVTAS